MEIKKKEESLKNLNKHYLEIEEPGDGEKIWRYISLPKFISLIKKGKIFFQEEIN